MIDNTKKDSLIENEASKEIKDASIKKVQSIEELNKLGSKEEILDLLENAVYPIKIKASTYEELLGCIEILRQKWMDWTITPNGFANERNEYLFYLTKISGKQRNELLGITNELYDNKELAKKWYRKIVKILEPDINLDENTKIAFQTLNKLYEVMIED